MASEQTAKAPAKSAKRTGDASKEAGASAGAVKAALWVLSAEEDLAVDTLANLDENEIRRLYEVVRHLGETTSEQLDAVHQEFRTQLKPGVLHLRGSQTYLSKLTTRALGEQKATRLLTVRSIQTDPTESLERADLDILAPVLAAEHPQIIAAVLASLDSHRAAEILPRLPEGIRGEVVRRMTQLAKVPRSALAEVERVLAAGLPVSSDGEADVDGMRQAALILNQLEAPIAESVLAALKSEELTGNLRRAMFTFDDLAQLDKRAFQVLLKEVPSEQLLTALKTANEKIREQVFASLSKRAAEMLKDDLEVLGPVRLADVEQAQQAIVDQALRLRNEGKLAIAGGGGEELV